jgi:hypothetical protein
MDRGYWLFFLFGIFVGQEGFHAFHDGKLAAEEEIACYHGRHETLPALQPSTRLFWWLVFG